MPTNPAEHILDELQGTQLRLDIQEKYGAIERISSSIDAALDLLSDASRVSLMEVIDEIGEGRVVTEQAIKEYDPDSTEYVVLQRYAQGRVLTREVASLEEQHKLHLINEVVWLAKDVSSRFDWEALINYYDRKSRSSDRVEDDRCNGIFKSALASTLAVREILGMAEANELDQLSYHRVEWLLGNIQKDLPEWEKREFTRPSPADSLHTNMPASPEKRAQLKHTLEEHLGRITEYFSLKCTFRDRFSMPHSAGWFLAEVATSLSADGWHSDYDAERFGKYGLDPRYLDAVSEFTTRYIDRVTTEHAYPLEGEDYDNNIKRLKEVSPEKTTRAVEIIGIESKSNATLVVLEDELREQLGLFVPACFLNKIRFIVVKKRPGKLNSENPDIETVGLYNGEYDAQGTLTKSGIEVYIDPNVPDESRRPYMRYIKEEFMLTVFHEVGHSMHSDMDYQDMKTWVEVVKEDTTSVTGYVRRSRETSERRGLQEDFCETFSLFICDPLYLMGKSPKRFVYMTNLATKYMGDRQEKRFALHLVTKLQEQAEQLERAEAYMAEIDRESDDE